MKFKVKIPWFPLIVLIFYLVMMFLWSLEAIPPPESMINFLEMIVNKIGIIGVLVVSFVEGLAFIGHQFPGMTLILISLMISEGNFTLLASLVAAITLALTLSSLANYFAGYMISKKKEMQPPKRPSKTLFLSALHPNFLSLYFFHAGMNKKSPREIILVPVIIFPYGLLISVLIYFSSGFIRNYLLKEELFFLGIFSGWFLVELYRENRKKLKTMGNSKNNGKRRRNNK